MNVSESNTTTAAAAVTNSTTTVATTTMAASTGTTALKLEWSDIADGNFWAGQVRGLLDTAYVVALKVIYALVILIIGWLVIKLVCWLIGKAFKRMQMNVAVNSFLTSLIKFFLWMVLFLQIFKILEIPNTSFTAVMSALAFAIGLALSGFLNNILAGLMIISTKPFVVGDFINGGGAEGVVQEITITHTIVLTGDNKRQIVPNVPLATGTVINFSKADIRRVDMVFGIAHEADMADTRKMFRKILAAHPLVLKDPAFVVEPEGFTPHALNWLVRPWVKTGDYWSVHFDVHETVKARTEELGISIPFPQAQVNLFKPAPPAEFHDFATEQDTDNDDSDGADDDESQKKTK